MSQDPLRIVLVGDYPADATLGSPKVLYKLRDALVELGHDAVLLTRDHLGATPRQRHLRDAVSPWLAARALARHVAGARPRDVIDASSAEGLLMRRRFPEAAVVARSHGLEHLNFARMLDDARAGLSRRGWHRRVWYPAVRMRLVALAAARADQMIVPNARDREFAIARGWQPEQDVHVVPHGLAPVFLNGAPEGPRGHGVLFCGSWDAVKGTEYLVRGFTKAARERSDLRLTVLGPGYPAAAVLSCFDARIRDRVRVLERMPEEMVAREYARHDVLVACSTFEGFGMVVPEAMSQMLPVIATPVGVAGTLVQDGRTGVLVPPRDADAIARAILALAADPARARSLAAAARPQVARMTWAETARATIDVYRSAIERAAARRAHGR
ncbi:MAG TPA: glycosyltransferase family 4 protein [Vicinamibacterales bacterium]|nr:glycosyltransferase family 4 protein [Vicinamibacterales bacterium]